MADLWMAIVVSSAVCGLFGYGIARGRGRNAFRGALAGIVFNLVGLALYSKWKSRRAA
jgi:hypothetical protein